jgi:hypothetical protein
MCGGKREFQAYSGLKVHEDDGLCAREQSASHVRRAVPVARHAVVAGTRGEQEQVMYERLRRLTNMCGPVRSRISQLT